MPCNKCGEPIRDPAFAEICLEHTDEENNVVLHADCGCPEHGWGSERESVGETNPDEAFQEILEHREQQEEN